MIMIHDVAKPAYDCETEMLQEASCFNFSRDHHQQEIKVNVQNIKEPYEETNIAEEASKISDIPINIDVSYLQQNTTASAPTVWTDIFVTAKPEQQGYMSDFNEFWSCNLLEEAIQQRRDEFLEDESIHQDAMETLKQDDMKGPFLLRFPIGFFGISLGLGSQTVLWKALAYDYSINFLHIPNTINLIVWCLAIATFIVISTTYLLKCILHFDVVCCEFYHPVRINFFFAPWVTCILLSLGVPPIIATSIHPTLWCIFMAPIFILELKIYGQWLSRGERRLSKVANPSTHLSLMGNFVGALLASSIGWKEIALFFWAIGLAHYLVLFVTLYQRLPTVEAIPKELHPIFFLFVAVPNTASVAWENIVGDFDYISKISYFVGLFLYSSLVVRVKFFYGIRFSVTWWAYTFPMTAAAIATIHYSHKVISPTTQGLAILLSCISSVMVLCLFFSTLFHALFGETMFPNDTIVSSRMERICVAKT